MRRHWPVVCVALCRSRTLSRLTLAQLREIDLYDFQGLVKAEGKDRFGAEYLQWQKAPHDFMLGGRAPVRELWYR